LAIQEENSNSCMVWKRTTGSCVKK
jgi:hypothetical protein